MGIKSHLWYFSYRNVTIVIKMLLWGRRSISVCFVSMEQREMTIPLQTKGKKPNPPPNGVHQYLYSIVA